MSFEEPNNPRSSEIVNNQIQLTELATYEERTPGLKTTNNSHFLKIKVWQGHQDNDTNTSRNITSNVASTEKIQKQNLWNRTWLKTLHSIFHFTKKYTTLHINALFLNLKKMNIKVKFYLSMKDVSCLIHKLMSDIGVI